MRTTFVKNLVVSTSLEDSHIMLLLILSNLATHTHTLGKKVHKIVVKLVNLLAQFVYSLSCNSLVAHNKQT